MGCLPSASVRPTATPERRPPPVKSATPEVDQWSRPAEGFTLGVLTSRAKDREEKVGCEGGLGP
jgi:hypothetical protein